MAKASSSITSFGMIPIVAAIVGSQKDSFADVLREFPLGITRSEVNGSVVGADKSNMMPQLTRTADLQNATLTTIDELRLDFPDGWLLIKTSNREPTSTVRFHANSQETLEDIKMAFIETLQEVREDLYFA